MKLIIWLSLFVHLSSFVFAHRTDRFHNHLVSGGSSSGITISCSDWEHRSDCEWTFPTLPLQCRKLLSMFLVSSRTRSHWLCRVWPQTWIGSWIYLWVLPNVRQWPLQGCVGLEPTSEMSIVFKFCWTVRSKSFFVGVWHCTDNRSQWLLSK